MPGSPLCWPFRPAGCEQVLGEFSRIGAAPDGRHVYVTLGVKDAIVRYARDRGSGLLAEAVAEPVCGGRSSSPPCPTLGGLEHLVFGSDARRAYVMLGSTVLAHRRDPQTGRLTAAPFPAGCVTMGTETENCRPAPPVRGSYRNAVVSPDGRFLYVLAAGGIVVLSTE